MNKGTAERDIQRSVKLKSNAKIEGKDNTIMVNDDDDDGGRKNEISIKLSFFPL